MLKDLTAIIVHMSQGDEAFKISDAIETAGYSKAIKSGFDGHKLFLDDFSFVRVDCMI